MTSKETKILVTIIATAAVVAGIVYAEKVRQRQATPQPQNQSQSADETAGWKTYRNEQYGFEVRYPKDWDFKDHGATLTPPNRILSSVSVSKDGHNFSVRVDENEPQYESMGPKQKTHVTVAGENTIAYVFPEGYECYGVNPPNDVECSFFAIKVFHNNLWYAIDARGSAQSVSGVYAQIISTFKFIR